MSKSIRLPDYLATEIERLAAEEKRSLANMVKVLLEQALKMERSLSERGEVLRGNERRSSVSDENATVAVDHPRSESDFKGPDFK